MASYGFALGSELPNYSSILVFEARYITTLQNETEVTQGRQGGDLSITLSFETRFWLRRASVVTVTNRDVSRNWGLQVPTAATRASQSYAVMLVTVPVWNRAPSVLVLRVLGFVTVAPLARVIAWLGSNVACRICRRLTRSKCY